MATNVYSLQKQLEKIKKKQKENIMDDVQYLIFNSRVINNELIYYANHNLYNIIRKDEFYRCIVIIPATLKNTSKYILKKFSDVVKIISIHNDYFIIQCQDNDKKIKIMTYL